MSNSFIRKYKVHDYQNNNSANEEARELNSFFNDFDGSDNNVYLSYACSISIQEDFSELKDLIDGNLFIFERCDEIGGGGGMFTTLLEFLPGEDLVVIFKSGTEIIDGFSRAEFIVNVAVRIRGILRKSEKNNAIRVIEQRGDKNFAFTMPNHYSDEQYLESYSSIKEVMDQYGNGNNENYIFHYDSKEKLWFHVKSF